MSQQAPSPAVTAAIQQQGTPATAVAASAPQPKPVTAEQDAGTEKQDRAKKEFIKSHAGLTTVPVKVKAALPAAAAAGPSSCTSILHLVTMGACWGLFAVRMGQLAVICVIICSPPHNF
jgi:hypothetical protein